MESSYDQYINKEALETDHFTTETSLDDDDEYHYNNDFIHGTTYYPHFSTEDPFHLEDKKSGNAKSKKVVLTKILKEKPKAKMKVCVLYFNFIILIICI